MLFLQGTQNLKLHLRRHWLSSGEVGRGCTDVVVACKLIKSDHAFFAGLVDWFTLLSFTFINSTHKDNNETQHNKQLDNTAKRCGIMAVLHITYYDVSPWPMTMTTNVAKECKNEKHKNNLTQSSQRTKSRDMRSSKFTLGSATTLKHPLRKKYSRKVYTWPYLNICKISTF